MRYEQCAGKTTTAIFQLRQFFLFFCNILKYFTNPTQRKYACTGLGEAEVAFLNDFHWSKELIAWHELLDLLEGSPCKSSRPNNDFATDSFIRRSNSIPFFATGIKSIEFVGAYGQRNERETDMMDNQ